MDATGDDTQQVGGGFLDDPCAACGHPLWMHDWQGINERYGSIRCRHRARWWRRQCECRRLFDRTVELHAAPGDDGGDG